MFNIQCKYTRNFTNVKKTVFIKMKFFYLDQTRHIMVISSKELKLQT